MSNFAGKVEHSQRVRVTYRVDSGPQTTTTITTYPTEDYSALSLTIAGGYALRSDFPGDGLLFILAAEVVG